MKTASDPRHQKRIEIVKCLFAYSFDPAQTTGLETILPNLEEIDKLLATHATERPLNTINKLDLAILRLGVFELVYNHVAIGVVIDEAVEIAKEFGGETSSKFVNAVLGAIAKTI